MKETLKTKHTVSTVDENNILEIEFQAGQDVTLEESIQIHDWVTSLIPDRKHYCIAIAKFGTTADPEVREWLSSEGRLKTIAADAFIVSSLAQKIVANFYLKYNKPKQPTRAFTNLADARKWIMQFVEAEKQS